MQFTTVSTSLLAVATMIFICGYWETICGSSSRPERFGMRRSSTMTVNSSRARSAMTVLLSLSVRTSV